MRARHTWAIGPGRSLSLGSRTLIMGVVNATPDSFFDGGRHNTAEAALDQALRLIKDGADIIDIGGESTRPGSGGTSPDEELERTIPVIEALAARSGTPISIDTKKAVVARQAIKAGASIINDISAMRADEAMIPLAAASGAGVVLMHMRGSPADMQTRTDYTDLAAEVAAELEAEALRVEDGGVSRQAIVLDPGIGFAKTAEQNLELLQRTSVLAELGYPLLIGPSRKSFIGVALATADLPDDPDQRLEGSIAAAALSAYLGGHIIRVHDVAQVRKALTVADALREGRFCG